MTILLDRPTEPLTLPPVAPRMARRVPTDLLVVAGLLLVVLLVQGWNITGYPGITDDEGTYLAQAWAVQQGSLAHYTYWYDHPPAGWIQLAALSWIPAVIAPDTLAVASARLVMLLVTAVCAVLMYVLARRLSFARWSAALTVVVFGLSPLSVTLQRQIYLDTFAVAWVLGAFVLALSPRKHLWHHVAAGACTAVAILSKETILIVLPAVIVAVWQGSDRTTRKFSLVGFGCGLTLVAAVYPLYALLKGELMPGEGHVSLLGAALFQVADRAGSGSIFTAGSGANALLDSWLFYDAVLLIAGVVATVLALGVRRLRAPAVAGALLTLVAMRPGGYLPAMYVIQALPFFALSIAGVAEVGGRYLFAEHRSTWAYGREARRVLAIACAVAAVAFVVPRWYDGDRTAMTARANQHYAAAVAWIDRSIDNPGETQIVVDDAVWLDLVEAGFEPQFGSVWFYKLDLDSAVMKQFPRGWRDMDYIVSSPIVRQNRDTLATVDTLLTRSTVVKAFGTGDDRIEIRRITQEGS
jgi:4-amino-4-deoxy-L-arabinose transferase-like glycosyltransferase